MGNNVSAIPEPVWVDACVEAFTYNNLTHGLVDLNGNPTSVFGNDTWGVTFQACYEVCGPDKMYQAFNFESFSTAFTNWLLPWLALTAQLPYESAGPGSNVLSGLMAIGSPALITYSLTLTILNRYWIKQSFSKLKRVSQAVSDLAPHINERIDAAEHLLQDAQQAPIRVSQKDGWLSSLVVLRDNQAFWKSVHKDLNNTRRRFSASLFAQIIMAFIAYLFTIIGAFKGGRGNDDVGSQIASGSIWIWMIPVIFGWVRAGTQWRAGAINDAIHDASRTTFLALSEPDINGNVVREERQQGITASNYDHLKASDWLGCSVIGDEREEGPIYNYSRIFTWSQAAFHIEGAFSDMLSNLCQGSQTRKQVNGDPWNGKSSVLDLNQQDPLAGTSFQVAEYCNLPLTGHLNAYTSWCDIQARVWHHIFFAGVVALFVQWGTTGPGILIAYLTPMQGLGCRSGSYALYGSAATIAWFFLTISCFISHAVMLRYQNLPYNDFKTPRKFGHSIFCSLAVCTRYMGKSIAVVNAGWLVVSSLLEYIGTFSRCWCYTNALSKGNQGWAPIFHTAENLYGASALGLWGSALAFSLLTCAISTAFFWLASGYSDDGDS